MSDQVALGELVRDAERRAERERYVGAVYRSGTVLALGATLYFGCWVYSAFSNMREEFNEFVTGMTQGAEVAPEVFSDEGFQILDEHYAGRGLRAQGGFRRDYSRAEMLYKRDGKIKALPWALDKVDKWEGVLASHGVIEQRVSTVHPVDKTVGIVLNNKWYWGAVLGLAALPAFPVVRDVMENAKREI